MHNIIIISSFHKNLGKCNPNELYKIIEEIQPGVIFEELCFETFSMVYADNSIPNTIEAIAIKNYIRNYSVKHFPVDTYPLDERDLFSGADKIANRSPEYINLWNKQISMITNHGFDFINSNACYELLDKISDIEKKVLTEINDIKLSREYESERALNNNRECEMLKNIYDYSRKNDFNIAVFICGVEHRKPLKNKIQEKVTKEELNINWKFYNDN